MPSSEYAARVWKNSLWKPIKEKPSDGNNTLIRTKIAAKVLLASNDAIIINNEKKK